MHPTVREQETETAVGRPYLTLVLVAVSHSASHMYTALMPIIFPHAMAQFGFSYSQLGLMLGLSNGLSSLLQGIYGFLSRRVMRRVILGAGNVMLALSMFLTALAGGFPSFFAFNVLGRISYSPQHPVGNSLVSESFGKKLRGTAFAINFAGGNAGTLLIPVLGTAAVVSLGWQASLSLFALLPLVVGLACAFIIPEQRRNREKEGREKGGWQKGGVRAAGRDFFDPLKNRNVLWVVITATVAAGGRGIGVVMNYVPLYFQTHLHLGATDYATLYTLLMAGSVAGPLLAGRFSDIFGRKRLSVITYLLSLLSALALLGSGENMIFLTISIVFMGLVVYSQNSLVQALLADVAGRDMWDMAYSVFFTVSYLAGAVWSYILGICIDSYGFGAGFIIMACSYLAGAAALLPVRSR